MTEYNAGGCIFRRLDGVTKQLVYRCDNVVTLSPRRHMSWKAAARLANYQKRDEENFWVDHLKGCESKKWFFPLINRG